MSLPSLLVFGPQTTWPIADQLVELRAVLINEPRLRPLLSAIKDLPNFWLDLVEHEPQLKPLFSAKLIDSIPKWVETGDLPLQGNYFSNLLTMPFTVIIQITQYIRYFGTSVSHRQVLEATRKGGIQGFCAGILTAAAVACSKSDDELGRLASTALKLAVCIGAYADLDSRGATNSAETSSLAIRWKSQDGSDKILDILKDYPQSYISVVRDLTDVTVTTPKTSIASLSQKLFAADLQVKATGLEGRYHCSDLQSSVDRILDFCATRSDLRLPSADRLIVPVRSNTNAQMLLDGSLHEHALRCIMLQMANWHLTISAATTELLLVKRPTVVSFGFIETIPSSILRESNLKVIKARTSTMDCGKFDYLDSIKSANTPSATPPVIAAPQHKYHPDKSIAIIGMACKFPGADSVNEFWDLLTSGGSMLQEMPKERFSTQGLRRSDGKLRYWGNFMRDVDSFDHKFFKKSSREAASTDPQQRLLLQVAYEAMESAGYFGGLESTKADVGCYLGVCSTDYNDNVASHPPNAFSSLGTLRAFLSGRISHYFGWTGPSVTCDTACSSSAVAIHSACKAIQAGECSQALAGGASIYTSPYFYQNLAAASFLSPTGATKPFDAKADGYCRGEGVGLVVLKKLSSAVADGDNILGVIAGSAVNQNMNSTYITVPHSPSQIDLYQKVSNLAGVNPKDVSYVEAHGTGTPVGDPIEFESIRQVFGSPLRRNTVNVASVKGNIGHLEGASGVAALIKTLLMIQYGVIPKQANFNSLNPKIPALEPDRMSIPVTTQRWESKFRAACINNYGAAGSNAAMIICQPPSAEPKVSFALGPAASSTMFKYPIFISASTATSLKAFCSELQKYCLKLLSTPVQDSNLLGSLAFNLADKQNQALTHFFTTTATSLKELNENLIVASSGSTKSTLQFEKAPKPVVLVFGGQTSRSVGLSKEVYDNSVLLRSHLDHCDSIMRSLGLEGLYPGIFQTEPVEDVVQLHSMLFALQYSCAKSWIDSGLKVDTLVGHSFGQLTALSVSGSLPLKDGMRLVSGRATLMQKHWGSEKGSMISVEADTSATRDLISLVLSRGNEHKLEIACYNGPNSHVLVGSEASVQLLSELLEERAKSASPIKFKKLNVTNGFHSVFTEPLLSHLGQLAEGLSFSKPEIPLETCSESESWTVATPDRIKEHTRTPVYFSQAIQRISARLGPCTWLEAGSGSGVTNMVRRVVGSSSESNLFQASQLNAFAATGLLADTTVNLWKAGHQVQYWPFHRSQRQSYTHINLPPYQFDKARHWVDWVDSVETTAPSAAPVVSREPEPEPEPKLLALKGFKDQSQDQAEFKIDSRSQEYKLYVLGHAVLAEPLCPAPLYVELAASAALQLKPTASNAIPCVEELEIKAPLGAAAEQDIKLLLKRTKESDASWAFEFQSSPRKSSKNGPTRSISHATGFVTLRSEDRQTIADFARYDRLIGYDRFERLQRSPGSEAMQGSMIYKVFAKVVTYASHYKGVRSVCSKDGEVAGQVTLPKHNEESIKTSATFPLAVDNFIQVAGLHVNSLNECGEGEVFVCTKVDRIQPGPSYKESMASSENFMVYSNFEPAQSNEVINDIFVFTPGSKKLCFMVLGAHFKKVSINGLAKVLSRANVSSVNDQPIRPSVSDNAKLAPSPQPLTTPLVEAVADHRPRKVPKQPAVKTPSIDAELRGLLSKITEVSEDLFTDESTLEELGIDSLMNTEVMNEVCKHFDITIPSSDFQLLGDFKSMRDYLTSKGCGGSASLSASDSDSASESSSDFSDTAPAAVTRATTVVNVQVADDSSIAKLAKLVSGHLETTITMTPETNLVTEGLDSLLSIELFSDIQKAFDVQVDASNIEGDLTFGDLTKLVLPQKLAQATTKTGPLQNQSTAFPSTTVTAAPLFGSGTSAGADTKLEGAQQAFESIRSDYDKYTKETGFYGFWNNVYPTQERLVLAYTVEAFSKLGCPLASLRAGESLPAIAYLPRHEMLVSQLKNILKDSGLVEARGNELHRTGRTIDPTPSTVLFNEIVERFPQHSSEHRLLHITGSKLAECLKGTADPLQLLFRIKENKALLEDVYTNGPMYEAITKLLGSFLVKAYSKFSAGQSFDIIELGGGTGGTTKYIVDFLDRQEIPFTYTFTDIAGSLVTAAKKKFAGNQHMKFMTLDIEKAPAQEHLAKYHTVISTNCIHATKNLMRTTSHIRQMLRPDGFVSLVEFTRNMYWFDLVFGLLDGWWLFNDSRKHVLADEWLWDASMKTAGFNHVTWTEGPSEESRTLRVITGFNADAESESLKPKRVIKRLDIPMETVLYKQAGDLPLYADIYYPDGNEGAKTFSKRPIILLLHGGGHVMFTRKEVDRRQIKQLLQKGFLPISIDYTFCPEKNIKDGPMTDVCDALRWARYQLPHLALQNPLVKADGERVGVIGWSTGGTLAMQLAFTARQQNLRPPEAILAFYCPAVYEDPWWKKPIYPKAAINTPEESYDLLDSVQDKPTAGYYPPICKYALDIVMALSDPRWRIVLHMNWKAQTLPVLLNGLPNKKQIAGQDPKTWEVMEMPSDEQIESISPHAQIVKGTYQTPTYLIHGTYDDMIPWEHSQKCYDALVSRGIKAGISVVEGAEHLFDVFGTDRLGGGNEAVAKGFEFLEANI